MSKKHLQDRGKNGGKSRIFPLNLDVVVEKCQKTRRINRQIEGKFVIIISYSKKRDCVVNKFKVSIIVPFYNAQATLQECLDSIAKQTLQEWQLILVDDGSKDGSFSIASAFEAKYPDQVVLVSMEANGGPGKARNVALQYAKGEYIGFVDADDMVTEHMYELLYQEAMSYRDAAGQHYDLVDTGFYNQGNDTAILFTADNLTGKLDAKKRSTLIASGGYIWSKIYKRAFLQENGIQFREEYVLEDMDFMVEVFAKASSIGNVKQILYLYRDTASSLSKTVEVEKYYHSTTTAMKSIYDKVSNVPNYPGIRDAVEYSILQLYSYSVNVVLMGLKEIYETKGITEEQVLDAEQESRCRMESLRDMKKIYVQGGYDSVYTVAKIDKEDIDVMEQNDRNPQALIDRLRSVCGK